MRTIDGYALDPVLQGTFFLPYDASEIIYCSLSYDGQNYTRLAYRERDWIERFATPVITLPGNVPWFYRAENLAWPYQNPGHFVFTTTNLSPLTVYLEGRDSNNYPQSESFVLQGTLNPDNSVNPGSITSSLSYQSVTVISKDVGDDPLAVRADRPGTTIQMAPAMTELVFTQIVLTPLPLLTNADGSPRTAYVRIQVKLKPDSLSSDYSVPRISSVWDALICFVTSSLYRRLQQVAKAQEQEQEAMEHVKAAINVEKNQAEFRQQVVPVSYESGNYLDGWWWWRGDSANPFGGFGS